MVYPPRGFEPRSLAWWPDGMLIILNLQNLKRNTSSNISGGNKRQN